MVWFWAFRAKKVEDHGIKTSLDIVSEQSNRFARVVRPALKHCDYVVINEVDTGSHTQVFQFITSTDVLLGCLRSLTLALAGFVSP